MRIHIVVTIQLPAFLQWVSLHSRIRLAKSQPCSSCFVIEIQRKSITNVCPFCLVLISQSLNTTNNGIYFIAICIEIVRISIGIETSQCVIRTIGCVLCHSERRIKLIVYIHCCILCRSLCDFLGQVSIGIELVRCRSTPQLLWHVVYE